MSNDRVHMIFSGANAAEFFEQFDEMARKFGYVPEVVGQSVQGKESEKSLAPKKRGRPPLSTRSASTFESERPLSTRSTSTCEGERPKSKLESVESAEAFLKEVIEPAEAFLEKVTEPVELVEPIELVEPVELQQLTINDVKMAAARFVKANNGDPASLRELLSRYGQTRITPLPEDKWAEFISSCDNEGVGR